MKYEKCCRNCEYAYLESCKSCSTFGDNAYENFELRKELAKIESGNLVEFPCKVGDTVYAIKRHGEDMFIEPEKAVEVVINESGVSVKCTIPEFPISLIECCLTEGLAEAKLAELRG